MKKYDWIVYELMVLCDEGFEKEWYTGMHNGHKVRLNCNGCVNIGDDDFDRWANSVAVTIQPQKKKFAGQFIKAFAELKGGEE